MLRKSLRLWVLSIGMAVFCLQSSAQAASLVELALLFRTTVNSISDPEVPVGCALVKEARLPANWARIRQNIGNDIVASAVNTVLLGITAACNDRTAENRASLKLMVPTVQCYIFPALEGQSPINMLVSVFYDPDLKGIRLSLMDVIHLTFDTISRWKTAC